MIVVHLPFAVEAHMFISMLVLGVAAIGATIAFFVVSAKRFGVLGKDTGSIHRLISEIMRDMEKIH